jgi:hypothetical protein
MADVFISYASEDRDRVRALAEALERQGLDVWWDREIPLGSSFDEVIEGQLRDARCVVVAWTNDSVRSRWVRAEAAEALRRGVLIPVLFDNVEIPLEFRRIQAASLVDWEGALSHAAFARVESAVRAMRQRAAGDAGAAPAPPHAGQSRPDRESKISIDRSSVRVVGILALVALVAMGAYYVASRGPVTERSAEDLIPASTPSQSPAADATNPAGGTPTMGDAADALERSAPVRVVRVLMREGDSLTSHGFVTPTGRIIIFAPTTDRQEYFLTWIEAGQRRQGRARVVTQRNDGREVPYLAMLTLVDGKIAAPPPTTRNAASLRPGDRVERYLSPTDRTPGRVVEYRRDFSMGDGRFPALVTTYLSGPGDAGAPVVDEDGRVVAVVVGGRGEGGESYSIPIETIKLAFQDAF